MDVHWALRGSEGMGEAEDFKKLVVCVADDDRPSRMIAARWLEHAGFRVMQAEDGAATLELLRSHGPSIAVLLLDVMMPRMDGFEVLERMASMPECRGVPVVLLTAHANDEDDVVRGIETGADHHLAKPFSGKILVAKVRSLYRRRWAEMKLDQRLRAAESLATTDALTGLCNRRQFDAQLRQESLYSERHQQPFALLMVDLDHFKSVNDNYGHPEGDRVLQYVAKCLSAALRGSDQAFRFGGEEFTALLRGCDRERAQMVAERVRARIHKSEFTFSNGDQRRITASIGIAFADQSNQFEHKSLLERADAALYRAKRCGRDRVEAEPMSTPPPSRSAPSAARDS
jgi:diguanylate cyclase (GGDEF)-like protein